MRIILNYVEYYNISTAIEYLIDKIKVITYSADY